MSLGFFVSSAGTGATEPNDWVVLLWIGGISLAVGLLTLGIALLAGTGGPRKSPPSQMEPYRGEWPAADPDAAP